MDTRNQPHPEEQAFLDAIAAEPDDETHRLVFGDWLEDRGDPRAAWVRDADIWAWMAPDAGDPIPRLLAALEEEELRSDRYNDAQIALGKLGSAMVEPLREWVRVDPDTRWDRTWDYEREQEYDGFYTDVGSLLEQRPEGLRSVEDLVRDLKSEEWYTVWQAIVDLGFHGLDAGPAVPALLETGGHAKWEEFYDWGPENPYLRALYRSLAEMGPAADLAVPRMVEVVWFSPSAKYALLKLRPDPLVVLRHLNDDEHNDTLPGLEVVRDLDPTRTAALIHAVRNRTGQVRFSAINLLGAMGEAGAEAVPVFVELLTQDSQWDRTEMIGYVARALAGIGEAGRAALPALLAAREEFDPTDDSWEATEGRIALAFALSGFEQVPEALRLILPYLENSEGAYRGHYQRLLSGILSSREEADEPILDLLASDNPAIQEAGLTACDELFSPHKEPTRDLSGASKFLEPVLAATEPTAPNRNLAIVVLGRLGDRARNREEIPDDIFELVRDRLVEVLENPLFSKTMKDFASHTTARWRAEDSR